MRLKLTLQTKPRNTLKKGYNMEQIIAQLEAKGFSVTQTKTLHNSDNTTNENAASNFYQLRKDDVIYPKSRGNKQDIGGSTITTCFDKFGIDGVIQIFGAN